MAQEGSTSAFLRSNTDYMTRGPVRVTWEMARHFKGRAPLNFQLQVGTTGNPEADDWQDVPGAFGVNVFTLSDPSPRSLGKTLSAHYRVKLMDGDNILYYSQPATSEGGLTKAEWLEAREMIFRESLLNQKFAAVKGYLLKAKRYGTPCTQCLDPDTEEITEANCETCKNTRWVGGYYKAMPAQYAQIKENPTRTHVDTEKNRGTIADEIKRGRFLGLPQVYSYDVWVDSDSDQRYYLHEICPIAKLRGVPIIFDAELRLAEYSDVIYSVSLEGS
jgi:hypothetical protein